MLYVALAVFILHFCVLPITVSVRVDADSDVPSGRLLVKLFFIPVFIKKADPKAIKSVLDGSAAEEKRDGGSERSDKSGKKRVPSFFKKAGLRFLKRVRVRVLDLDAVIGADDAAATAYFVSSALILYGQACAFFCIGMKKDAVLPDYRRARLFVNLLGIFSFCFADIIYAVISQTVSNIARRIKGAGYGKRVAAE